MLKSLIFGLFLIMVTTSAFAQGIDSLKLSEADVPAEYTMPEELLCKSIQATILYEKPEMYDMLLGKVVEKGFQSFEMKGDKGTILYFVFDSDITDNAFIPGLLWGESDKPTKAHPEEYLANGNTLIVWSFERSSTIKKLSKEKVGRLL